MRAVSVLASHQSKAWTCQRLFGQQQQKVQNALWLINRDGFLNQRSPLFTSVQFLSKDSNDNDSNPPTPPMKPKKTKPASEQKQEASQEKGPEGNAKAAADGNAAEGGTKLDYSDLGENFFDKSKVKEVPVEVPSSEMGGGKEKAALRSEKMKVISGKVYDKVKKASVYSGQKATEFYHKAKDEKKKRWPTIKKKAKKHAQTARVVSSRAADKGYALSSVALSKTYQGLSSAANSTGRVMQHSYNQFRKIEFTNGAKMLYTNAKEGTVHAYDNYAPDKVKTTVTNLQTGVMQEMENTKVWWRLSGVQQQNTKITNQASYEELLALHDFKRDKRLTSLVVLCSCLPGGFVLLSIPILAFPRTMMPWSFWDDEQRKKFYNQYHVERKGSHLAVVNYLESQMTDASTSAPVKEAIDALVDGSGQVKRINNDDLLRLKDYCNRDPLDLTDTNLNVVQAMCNVFSVRPSSSIEDSSMVLRSKAIDLMNMDIKLKEMDLMKLSEIQVMTACFIRGLNSATLSHEANLYWLMNWLHLTSCCTKSDVWFVLYSAVLLSKDFSDVNFQRLDFGNFE